MARIRDDLFRSAHHPKQPSNGESPNMFRSLIPRGKAPHVCIVGAGVAGLRCADVLISGGCRVTIFEARSRIGGRVHQEQIAGQLVDMGPNWIHGHAGNPISEIASRTKTTTHNWDERQAVFDSSGTLIEEKHATQYVEFLWTTIAKAFEYSNDYSDSIAAEKSLMDYFEEQVNRSKFDPEQRLEVFKMAQMWGAFVGDPIARQSLKFFWLEECIEGDNAFVANTYKAILEDIAAKAKAESDLRLKEEVVSVEASTQNKITVTTISGIRQSFDQVVVTSPLGWLKRNNSAFAPTLPPRLSSAIDNISYGRLEKVYVTFPKAFWHDFTPPNRGQASNTSKLHYPGFTHFFSPDYVPQPIQNAPWNQECVSLAALPADCAHPSLLFYVFGPCATYIVSLVTDLPPKSAEYYNTLNRFFQPFYSKLPQYDDQVPICKPVGFLATQWQNDKFAGNGSYTNYQVCLEDGGTDIEVMREGMGKDRGVWLAGEHTAPFIALGTTTGAYWSGQAVARRICQLYGLHVPDDVGEGEPSEEDLKQKDFDEGNRTPDAANLNGVAL